MNNDIPVLNHFFDTITPYKVKQFDIENSFECKTLDNKNILSDLTITLLNKRLGIKNTFGIYSKTDTPFAGFREFVSQPVKIYTEDASKVYSPKSFYNTVGKQLYRDIRKQKYEIIKKILHLASAFNFKNISEKHNIDLSYCFHTDYHKLHFLITANNQNIINIFVHLKSKQKILNVLNNFNHRYFDIWYDNNLKEGEVIIQLKPQPLGFTYLFMPFTINEYNNKLDRLSKEYQAKEIVTFCVYDINNIMYFDSI